MMRCQRGLERQTHKLLEHHAGKAGEISGRQWTETVSQTCFENVLVLMLLLVSVTAAAAARCESWSFNILFFMFFR